MTREHKYTSGATHIEIFWDGSLELEMNRITKRRGPFHEHTTAVIIGVHLPSVIYHSRPALQYTCLLRSGAALFRFFKIL